MKNNYNLIISLLFLLIPHFLSAGIVVLNGLSHTHETASGEIQTGQIIIQNTNNEEQAVNLYLRDYLFYKTGEIKYDEPGGQQRSNTNWIKLSPAYVVLSPKEKKVITYEIKVPEKLPTNGTFWSVVMLEGVQKMDKDVTSNDLQIQTQIRYAVQLITHIGGDAKKDLKISDVKLTTIKTIPHAVIDLENTGEYLLSPHISFELFDQAGNSIGVFKSDKRKTFPGTSLRFKLPLKDVPSGKYKALLLADCGADNVFGMNLDLDL